MNNQKQSGADTGKNFGGSMFELYFSNIPDRGLVGSYGSLEEAKAAGRKYGFDFRVFRDGRLLGWSEMFRGWVDYAR